MSLPVIAPPRTGHESNTSGAAFLPAAEGQGDVEFKDTRAYLPPTIGYVDRCKEADVDTPVGFSVTSIPTDDVRGRGEGEESLDSLPSGAPGEKSHCG